MDALFKALADPVRRSLLDRLFEQDGQSLSSLAHGPAMTRYGVMKHLRVLESAGLVVTRKSGRHTLHYLNPVPLRLALEQWISKYAEPRVAALVNLKRELEVQAMRKPKHVYEVFIRTTPERLWEALTVGEFTKRYFFNTSIESSWRPGSEFVMRMEDDAIAVGGEVIEADPPKRLVQSWRFHYDPELYAEPFSRVTWEITQAGSTCRLTVVHEFESESKGFDHVRSGWPAILSGLKTLLETGEPLQIELAEYAMES